MLLTGVVFYYLNLQWNNQFVRQSLATIFLLDFEKVSQLAPLFANPQAFVEMLRPKISEITGFGRLMNANALKLVQADELPIVLSQGFSLY